MITYQPMQTLTFRTLRSEYLGNFRRLILEGAT